MSQKYDKAAEVEKQIMEYKDANIKDLIRPVDAFITFEEENGKNIAEKFKQKKTIWGAKQPSQKEFLGDDLILAKATEPTNIIWENRHFTPIDILRRSLKALACIFVLLIISFLTIYYFKSNAIFTAKMYPSIQQEEILRFYYEPADNITDNRKMNLFYSHAV
jgi:hypothetical protein